MMDVDNARTSWKGPTISESSPRVRKTGKDPQGDRSLTVMEASDQVRFEDSLEPSVVDIPTARSAKTGINEMETNDQDKDDTVKPVSNGDSVRVTETFSLNGEESTGTSSLKEAEDKMEEELVLEEDEEVAEELMEGEEEEEEYRESAIPSESSGTLTSVSLEVEESPANLVSAMLRPLSEMSKEELVKICGNLEVALSLKDQEMATINQHYEHLLNLYYETTETLAQRNSELIMCQGHLREAQACLRQWKTEILDRHQDLAEQPDRPRASIVSDSVLLETRARLVALAGDCGVVAGELTNGGSSNTHSKGPDSSGESKGIRHQPDQTMADQDLHDVDGEAEPKVHDLNNPKRVSRRMVHSMDFRGRSRITPVLHRRKSSRTDDDTKPVPKPRQSIGKMKNSSNDDSEPFESNGPQTFAQTFSGQPDEEPDLFNGIGTLSASMPIRMSYNDEDTHVDILCIDKDSRPSSSGSGSSEDTLTTDRRPPTAIEKEPLSEELKTGLTPQEDNTCDDGQEAGDVMRQNPDGAYSGTLEGRPRTSCGRPLTGERRPNPQIDDRPPTRSGPVAASYSFEGQYGVVDTKQTDTVHTHRSQSKENNIRHGQVKISEKQLTSKSMNFTPQSKPKHRIIFKEIKTGESTMVFPRPQTPHVRPRSKHGTAKSGMHMEIDSKTDNPGGEAQVVDNLDNPDPGVEATEEKQNGH